MINHLHRWLILRLILVWIFLSLLIGGLVRHFGQTRLTDHIVAMAQTETASYTPDFLNYLRAPSAAALTRFGGTINALIANDNLMVVEFYSATSDKIIETVKPAARETEARLPKHTSTFAHADAPLFEELPLDRELYLRVFVPILDPNGTKMGYLEGIYHAPEEIVSQNRSQTLWALLIVVVIIFITSLTLYPLIIRLNRKLLAYSHTLALTNIGMLKVLGSAIAKRDSDTNIHNFRVTLYSLRLGEKLHLSTTVMQGLIKGAFLHDVGKIAITDAILHKPGKLNSEEFAIMQTHVRHGGEILLSYDWLRDADEVVRCHHEKYDGSGYPAGLAGEAIPLTARIFAIADVFDALTSKRPYKEAFPVPASIAIIQEGRGRHFDPAITDLFLAEAESLAQEICHEDEPLLHAKLESYIKNYFR